MKDEYIIINKTTILKRIEELEEQEKQINKETESISLNINLKKQILLREILSQSTSLIPEIERAFDEGFDYREGHHKSLSKQDYISNLKLDI